MKTCFKCLVSKPLDEFYKHSQMADGHLNKCKSCTKIDTAENTSKHMNDLAWVERELDRHREKSARYRKAGIRNTQVSDSKVKWISNNPQKRIAHCIVANGIRSGRITRGSCSICGSNEAEAHHEDYSKPLEITWLCKTHHAARHVELNRLRRATMLS